MKLLLTTALVSMIGLTAPAQALDISDMTARERQVFRQEIRAYLLEHPELILEAVSLLEQRDAEAQAQADLQLVATHADAIFNDPNSWVGGNPEGDITLVEFLDYRCSFCRRATPEIEGLLAADGNIRVIVKEFPILGEQSLIASRFAIATQQVAGGDAYKAVHDALMAFSGDYSDVTLRRLSEGLGLDSDAIFAQMSSHEVDEVIAANHQLARALRISGTPTFVMQDQMLRGFVPQAEMAQMVAEIRRNR